MGRAPARNSLRTWQLLLLLKLETGSWGGGVLTWREGILTWRGGILTWRGGILTWRGGILIWRGDILTWRGGILTWRGGIRRVLNRATWGRGRWGQLPLSSGRPPHPSAAAAALWNGRVVVFLFPFSLPLYMSPSTYSPMFTLRLKFKSNDNV